jgi:hypothetical protein
MLWLFVNGKGLLANGKWYETSFCLKPTDQLEVVLNRTTGTLLFYVNNEPDPICMDSSRELVGAEVFPTAVCLKTQTEFLHLVK